MKNKNLQENLRKITLLLLITLLAASLVCEAEAAPRTFPDVTKTAYYYTPVCWALDEEIAAGRGGYFQPDKTCTRAEAVTFLYNLAKQPEVTAASSFVDVQDSSAWYYKAVSWAVENNITYGLGTINGQPAFRPEVTCSRAMIVTFLQNYAKYVAGNYAPAAGSAKPFPDVKAGNWYFDAVNWAAQNHITSGKGDGKFHPDDPCTRAQIVTFIYHYRQLEGSDHVHTWVTETIVDKPAWDETVKVRDAYDEQVLVRDAWDEQVKTKDAWDETVKVRDEWDEQVEVEGAWDEPVYEGYYVCAKCGYATQEAREMSRHLDIHLPEGGASYSVEPVQTGSIHHDPVYENVHHDTEYRTVHHDAEYATVHHDEEYTTVHHDAEYTTVHHDAETHTVTRCTSCGATK